MKRMTTIAIMIVLVSTANLYATINVLLYGDGSITGVATLNVSDKINAERVTDPDQITSELLSSYDVFFASTSYHDELDSKSSIIADFLQSGGGVVVGQSNVAGPIDWLPSGLEASVASRSYPDKATLVLTSSGQAHDIFTGLTAADMGTRPVDTLYIDDISPAWDVLSVYSGNSNMLGLAVAEYGGGRLVLWPTNIAYSSIDPTSLTMDENVLEWVSIPEPASLLLLALGAVAIRKRKA